MCSNQTQSLRASTLGEFKHRIKTRKIGISGFLPVFLLNHYFHVSILGYLSPSYATYPAFICFYDSNG